MERIFYLDLANKGQRMVFGTHLILGQKSDSEQILFNGIQLGRVYIETAQKYNCPIAMPLMELTVEKNELLHLMGIPDGEKERYKFNKDLSEDIVQEVKNNFDLEPSLQLRSFCEAIRYVKENSDLIPAGMLIGPFSFMTKLLSDPIIPVFMASSGMAGKDDQSIRNVELLLELAVMVIKRSAKMQIDAGAQLICVCEPAANIAYISPDMLSDEHDIFDRYVIETNKQIVELFKEHNVDLLLHDCGELSDMMIKKLCKLEPVILSLGHSRKLWEDAKIVPDDIILFGNISAKNLTYISEEQFERDIKELKTKMEKIKHPFIMGSECDILSITGYEKMLFERALKILTFLK